MVTPTQKFILVTCDREDGYYLPLLTSASEIDKFSLYNITDTTYTDYLAMLEDDSFIGFVINPSSDKFFFSKNSFYNLIKESYDTNIREGKIFSSNQLKEAKENINNKDLIDFLKGSFNVKELFDKINHSYLLTIIINEENINDEIIENNGFELLKTNDYYVLLFTNEEDLIKESKNYQGYLYTQLINLPGIVHFIFYDDLSGIILDKGSDHEFKITRDDLIKNLKQIEEKCYNVELENAFDYAFKLI